MFPVHLLSLSLRAIIIALFAIAAGAHSATAQEPYFKGKRVSLLVNFAPGGTTDIETRLLAKYLPRHIDGQPGVVVQNMDGAGGYNAVAYLGEVAPKDGTTVGYFGGTAWQYASEPERFRIDLKSYEFVGYMPGTTVYYMRRDVRPGMKEGADIIKAQGLVAGGNGPYNARDLIIRLTLDMLGVPYKYVTGYRSGTVARLALQRGEINFFAEPAPAYRSAVEPNLVANGEAIGVYYDPNYNGDTLSISNQVADLPIRPFQDLYQKVKGAKPSGKLWDVYLACLALNSAMARLVVMPPGTPEAAVTAMRKAMLQLNSDKAYAAESLKAIGFVPEYEAGPNTNRQARQSLAIRPDIKAFVADYIKGALK